MVNAPVLEENVEIVKQSTAEQIVDMSVPQFRKEFGEVIHGILQRTSERIIEQTDDVLDPQLLG